MREQETKPRVENLGTGSHGLRKTFVAADFFSWNDFALHSGQPPYDRLKRGELAGTNAYFAKEASSFFITCNRSRTSFWVACRAVAIAESLSRGLEVVDDVVSGSCPKR